MLRRSRTRYACSGTTTVWKPALIRICLSSGKRSRLRAFSASICWRACSTVAPGFSRATYDQLLLWRESSDFSSAVNASGIQTLTSGSRKPKPCGSTPTTVYGSPLIRTSWPTRVLASAEPLLPGRVGQDRLVRLADLPVLFGEDAAADRLDLRAGAAARAWPSWR